MRQMQMAAGFSRKVSDDSTTADSNIWVAATRMTASVKGFRMPVSHCARGCTEAGVRKPLTIPDLAAVDPEPDDAPTEEFSSNMVNIHRIWSIYSNMVNIIPLVQHFFSLPLGTNWLQIC